MESARPSIWIFLSAQHHLSLLTHQHSNLIKQLTSLRLTVIMEMSLLPSLVVKMVSISSLKTLDTPAIRGTAKKNAGEKLATRFLPDVTSQQPDSNSAYVNLASIPSNFDIQTRLVPAWQLGENGEPAPGNAPDVVGAFRFLCQAGHLAYDDPIVYPGQPGKSHLHQFFGNTETNAFSSYQSLRTSGNSTCMNDLNRSGYWIPAMFDGKGNVVKPEFVSIYYKRLPNTSPDCFTQGAKGCIPIPRGLRYVFGYDLVTNTTPTGGGYFNCDGPVGQCVAGHFSTITEAAANCAPGCKIGAVINAPDCWDGKRLDSPGHREHMANFGYGDWGYPKCPDTHPYVIPTFTLGAWYPVSDDRADTWFLSSDIIPGKPQLKAGESFHADWFGAWDDNILDGFENGCINDFLNCNTGNLGNYLQLKQISQDDGIRVVPIPERPL